MSKKIILCFDGTSNSPEDAEQERNMLGGVEDNSITNIFKLHLLFGGALPGTQRFPNQITLYYSGVGTYGNKINRIFNALLAPENEDVDKIIQRAGEELVNNYTHDEQDEIFLFGFSRGAAIARRFAALLGKDAIPGLPPGVRIRFMGLFDTVASIGVPDLNRHDRPSSDVVFEDNCVPGAVQEALHLLALDEKRLAFRPTLMRADPNRVTEVWFSGAHADVGGGYRKDGLSDVTLTFLLSELHRRGLGLHTRPAASINYHPDSPVDVDVDVDFDDVIIEPNPMGCSHQQKRPPLTTRLTLADRALRVDGGGAIQMPLVYQSVLERIHGDQDYRPASLRKVRHRIMNAHGESSETVDGLGRHLQEDISLAKPLAPGGRKEIIVQSLLKHNRTFIIVEKAVAYRFGINMNQKWKDASIECGPGGWRRDDPNIRLGVRELAIRLMEPFRRNPDADWFEVVGVVGNDQGEQVRPLHCQAAEGSEGTQLNWWVWTPESTGELILYANDQDRFYSNNIGSISVTIERL